MFVRDVFNIDNPHVHFAERGGFTFLEYTWVSSCCLCVWCFIGQKVCKPIILTILYVCHVLKVILIKYLIFCNELLVNFQYEHASRADFLTLGPRQELLDVVSNTRINPILINSIT